VFLTYFQTQIGNITFACQTTTIMNVSARSIETYYPNDQEHFFSSISLTRLQLGNLIS